MDNVRARSTVIAGGTGDLVLEAYESRYPNVQQVAIADKDPGASDLYPSMMYMYVIKIQNLTTNSKLIPIELGMGRMIEPGKFRRESISSTYTTSNGSYKTNNPAPVNIPINAMIEIIGYNILTKVPTKTISVNTNTTDDDTKIFSNETANLVILNIVKDTASEGVVFQQLSSGLSRVNAGAGVTIIDADTGQVVENVTTAGMGQQITLNKTAVPNVFLALSSAVTSAIQFLLNRDNHTGTQPIATVTGLETALDGIDDSLGAMLASIIDIQSELASKLTANELKTVNDVNITGGGNIDTDDVEGRMITNAQSSTQEGDKLLASEVNIPIVLTVERDTITRLEVQQLGTGTIELAEGTGVTLLGKVKATADQFEILFIRKTPLPHTYVVQYSAGSPGTVIPPTGSVWDLGESAWDGGNSIWDAAPTVGGSVWDGGTSSWDAGGSAWDA